MPCPRCQQENPSRSNFCLGCGAPLGTTCAACGADLPAGARFCNRCGAAVAVRAPDTARLAAPDAYTPKHLAECILTSKGQVLPVDIAFWKEEVS